MILDYCTLSTMSLSMVKMKKKIDFLYERTLFWRSCCMCNLFHVFFFWFHALHQTESGRFVCRSMETCCIVGSWAAIHLWPVRIIQSLKKAARQLTPLSFSKELIAHFMKEITLYILTGNFFLSVNYSKIRKWFPHRNKPLSVLCGM